MLIRVRTNAGLWRVENLDEKTSKPSDIVTSIATTRPNIVYERPLSFDPACENPLDDDTTLSAQNLRHGSMVHCRVDASTCATSDSTDCTADGTAPQQQQQQQQPQQQHSRRVIGADGSIQLVPVDDAHARSSQSGFRDGMLPLRDMKMQWTLQEFVDMDNQFVFKIQRQKERWVGEGGVSLDQKSADGFQRYLRNFAFQRHRFGLLYGRYVDEEEEEEEGEASGNTKRPKVSTGTTLSGNVVVESIDDMGTPSTNAPPPKKKRNKKVIVEAIYEPPQQPDPSSPEGYTLLPDPTEPHVDAIASHLNLRRVGWIFGHPPRDDALQLTSSEILTAAELQLEDADGVEETPFVTVKVTQGTSAKGEGDNGGGDVSFEAFQVSQQCMAMVAEGALEVGDEPGECRVASTFTALQEGKESRTVENSFFLTVVPIVQHVSDVMVCEFPGANREHDGREQSHGEMKRQLEKSGTAGWTFIDLLADFNLLIYLCNFLDVETDLLKICESIADRDVPLNEGHKLIIASMAGLDGNY